MRSPASAALTAFATASPASPLGWLVAPRHASLQTLRDDGSTPQPPASWVISGFPRGKLVGIFSRPGAVSASPSVWSRPAGRAPGELAPVSWPLGNGLCPCPADHAGSLSALGRRHEEPEAGAGDEEPANTPAGEEDRRAGKAGESLRLPGKTPSLLCPSLSSLMASGPGPRPAPSGQFHR